MKSVKYELPEDQFGKYPDTFQDVFQAVRTARFAKKGSPERKLADTSLFEALQRLAKQVNGEAPRLRVINFLYWNFQETIKSSWLLQSFNVNEVTVRNVVTSRSIRVVCPRCQSPYALSMKSRSDYESTMKALHYAEVNGSGQYNCQACQQQQREAREEAQRKAEAERQKEQAERNVRLQELLAMTYAEYLQSPAWKEVRAWAKREAKNRCQNCDKKEYKLWVHHINILSVRGEEKTTDLLVLCQDCHNQTYEEKARRRKEHQ